MIKKLKLIICKLFNIKMCKCERPTPQNPNKKFNPFHFML